MMGEETNIPKWFRSEAEYKLAQFYGYKEEPEEELPFEEEPSWMRKVTIEQKLYILYKQNWQCNICGCKLKFSSRMKGKGEVAHMDHIHPFNERSSYPKGIEYVNETKNLQALCPNCNLRKPKKDIKELWKRNLTRNM